MCFKGHYQENEKDNSEWEKISVNQMSDKGLVFSITNCYNIINNNFN